MSVTTSFGIQSVSLGKSGTIGIDAELLNTANLSLNNNNEALAKYRLNSGIRSSYLESETLEALFGMESVSTMKILDTARKNKIDILSISADDSDCNEKLQSLKIGESAYNEVYSAVMGGCRVIVPVQDISINSWKGAGYIIEDPQGGYTFRLSNHTSGGETSGEIKTFGENIDPLVRTLYIVAVILATVAAIVASVAFGGAILAIIGGAAIPAGFIFICISYIASLVSLSGSIDSLNEYLDGEADDGDKIKSSLSTGWSLLEILLNILVKW